MEAVAMIAWTWISFAGEPEGPGVRRAEDTDFDLHRMPTAERVPALTIQ